MNSGTRAAMTAMLSGEMVTIIGEARWLLLAVTMAVVADFWLGWSESRLRYAKAKRKGDKIVMSQYRWRTSRAWRRTLNKLVDYVVWLALGVFTGMAVLQPLGVDYRMGGVFAAIVAILCEAKSVVGHFLYLQDICIFHPLPSRKQQTKSDERKYARNNAPCERHKAYNKSNQFQDSRCL